jgi:predicted dehydrogenase
VEKLNVAVVGAGLLGTRHVRVFSEQANAQVVAVVDVNVARAEAAAEKFGGQAYATLAAALAAQNIHAVSIATPDHLHHDLFVQALQAGKHVLVEKPLATTEAEARSMAQAAAQSNCTAMVNYSQRYVADHAWIKARIAAGEIGAPRMVISVKFDTAHVPTTMLGNWSARTSPLFFMSSHDLDLVHWFFESEPTDVVAHETRGTLQAQGIPVHDGINALVSYANGACANFHASWIHPNSYPLVADGTMQIIGSSGALTYNMRTRTAEMFNSVGGQSVVFTGAHTANEIGGKIAGAFVSSVQQFIACIRTGREPDTSPQRTLATTLVQCAAIDSVRERRAVAVRYP